MNSAGSIVARYTFTQNIDEPLAIERSGSTSYYQADALGSVTSLTSSTGSVANTYTYDSFGNVTNSTGSLRNPFFFAGREYDNETSLYFNRARYYSPSTGRFISEDPIRFWGGANFYGYVFNSPTNFVDPFGLCGKQRGDKTFCALSAYAKNGISLGLDVLGFIPGEGIVKAVTQIGIGTVATVYSATQRDKAGAFLGIAGIHLSALEPVAVDAGGSLAKGIPILGWGLNVVSTGHDLSQWREDYQKCMSGEN